MPLPQNLDNITLGKLCELLAADVVPAALADLNQLRQKHGLNFILDLAARRFHRSEWGFGTRNQTCFGWAEAVGAVGAQIAYAQLFNGNNAGRILVWLSIFSSSSAQEFDIGLDVADINTVSAVVPQNMFAGGAASAMKVNSGNRAALPAGHKTIWRQPLPANVLYEFGQHSGNLIVEVPFGMALNVFAKTVNTPADFSFYWSEVTLPDASNGPPYP